MGLAKQVARNGIKFASRFIPYASVMRVARRDIYVLMYHGIKGYAVDPYVDNNTYRSQQEFEADLRFFLRHFHLLSAVDLAKLLRNGASPPKDSLILTFDDGLRANHDLHLPILMRIGVPATFFLNSAFIDNADLPLARKRKLLFRRLNETASANEREGVELYLREHGVFHKSVVGSLERIRYANRSHLEEVAKLLHVDFASYLARHKPYLSTEQVRTILANGFSIGAHSIDHPHYAELPVEDQIRQTIHSIKFIVERFALPYRLFAFPYNDQTLSRDFFERIRGYVDLTFGTAGFVDDPIDFSFQRSEIESTELSVESAFKYKLLTSYVYSNVMRRRIRR